jgi:divalent metal cation (Fe/Co/Zn/Cd) transporter
VARPHHPCGHRQTESLGSLVIALSVLVPLRLSWPALAPALLAVARAVPGVLNCPDIASRGVVGEQLFMELHLVLAPGNHTSAHLNAGAGDG